MNKRTYTIFVVGMVAWLGAQALPQCAQGADEDLLFADIPKVSLVSRHEEPVMQAPAAVTVLTQEDIRDSGLTSIPELLRMVPGLEVARIDANHWAISARGFNSSYANKLLVLIDGRTVYGPFFGGVFWNVQDLPLEDIERIEVVRGPGATLWGANAVNGVINIITKDARDSQGMLASVTYGTEDQPSATARFGGTAGTNLSYRAHLKYFGRDDFAESTGRQAADEWNATRGGFRLDWHPTTMNHLTLQGDAYQIDAGGTVDRVSLTPPFSTRVNHVDHNQGGNVLGRWTHTFSDKSEITLQAYYDRARQDDYLTRVGNDTWDVEAQHHFQWGERHDVVWGAGYRFQNGYVNPAPMVRMIPSEHHIHLFSAFVQDEILLVPERLRLTLGSKFEHNDFTGFEVQPSGRLAWTPTHKQTVWASVSRAVRTPDLADSFVRLNQSAMQPPLSPPVLVAVVGNQNLDSEELVACEIGYRIQPTRRLSFDVAAFYNVYDRLIAYVAGAPELETDPAPPHVLIPAKAKNFQRGATYGAEVQTEWKPTDNWKLVGSYSLLQMHIGPNSPGNSTINNDSPQHQFQIRSSLDLPHRVELNSALYYVDSVRPALGSAEKDIPSHVRLDLGVTWRPTKSLEISVWGQNLLENRHPEFTSFKTTTTTEIPRSVYGKVTWRF